jgi:phosphoenolpyruvate carboxykinase (ATP)
MLVPKHTWHDKTAYDATATKLAGLFTDNFRQYRDQVAPDVAAAGPRA